MNRLKLTVYSMVHFLVDFSGIFYLSMHVYPADSRWLTGNKDFTWLLLVLLYNFLAFAFPAFLGILADQRKNTAALAAFGCALICTGYLLIIAASLFNRGGAVQAKAAYSSQAVAVSGTLVSSASVLWSVILIGTGNGMFHIGGGVDILNLSSGRYAPPGVFISTGALGVFLGKRAGKALFGSWLSADLAVFSLMAFTALGVFRTCSRALPPASRPSPAPLKQLDNHPCLFASPSHAVFWFLGAALLFAVVIVRSYYGVILRYPWSGASHAAALSVLCLALGKMAGGFLADRIGAGRATAFSMGLAAILSPLGFGISSLNSAGSTGIVAVFCGLLSILLFNMTMPITLVLLARLLPRQKGFAFGILTLALFLGTLPSLFGKLEMYNSFSSGRIKPWRPYWLSPAGLTALCVLSLGMLLSSIWCIQRSNVRNQTAVSKKERP